MRNLIVLVGLCITSVFAVRLDISQEIDPAAVVAQIAAESGTSPSAPSLEKYVVPAGLEKCTVFATSDKAFSHFKTDLTTLSYQSENRWITKYLSNSSIATGDGPEEWKERAFPYWVLQNGKERSPGDISKFPYPVWDKDDTKFFFSLTQYDTDKTHLTAAFQKLPARRQYMVIIGTVEHSRSSDRREDEWKPKYACTGDTQLTYKYVVDVFRTGDDLTKWPLTDIPLGDYPIVGHPDSTIHARSSELKIDGALLTNLGRTSDRKAFWILDATYMSYADKVQSWSTTSEKDGDFAKSTFWSAIDNSWQDADKQKDYFGSKDGLNIIAEIGGACTQAANESACVKYSESSFFDTYSFNSEDQVAARALPIVVCGIFGKVWPHKKCLAKKSEGEARG